MSRTCTICNRPVLPNTPVNGATGNHWECQATVNTNKQRMADMATVVEWYVQLGSSRAEATKRVLQEQRLISMRKV